MTTSTWVLGFSSDPWQAAYGTCYDTHIGGEAVYPDGLDVTVPVCPRCCSERRLVLQAYSPHSNHHQRTLYLFGCNNILCSAEAETWWAIRACKTKVPVTGRRNSPGTGSTNSSKLEPQRQTAINWDTDSASVESSDSDVGNELALLSLEVEVQAAQEIAKVSDGNKGLSSSTSTVQARKAPKPEQHKGDKFQDVFEGSGIVPCSTVVLEDKAFEAFYVQVDYEPAGKASADDEASVTTLLTRYREQEKLRARGGSAEAWPVEKDDEDPASHYSEIFRERMSRAPTQLLRYKFGGEPIWPHYPPPECQQTCCACGANMVFEVQVLGTCLHYLQPEKSVAEHQCEAGMNFASVAVFSCAADCTGGELVAENLEYKVSSLVVCVQQDHW